MNKESFKEIVLDILRSESDETFNLFIKKLSKHLSGNDTLKLDGIGHFQVKREPLSRMERRGVESEKEILIFLPEGETSEDKILSFEVDDEANVTQNKNDSVFNIGINRPTVIYDNDEIEEDNDSKIIEFIEFIESGTVLENFDLLNNISFSSLNRNEIENVEESTKDDNVDFGTSEIFENQNLDSFEDRNSITEAKINKDFLIDDEDLEFDNDDLDLNNEHFDGLDNFDAKSFSTKTTLPDENSNNDDFQTDSKIGTNIESDSNPFDELENYINEESIDEAEELINETKVEEEERNTTTKVKNFEAPTKEKDLNKRVSYSSLRNKSGGIMKKSILFVAIAIVVIAVIIFFFLPKTENTNDESGVTTELNSMDNTNIGIIDSSQNADSNNVVSEKESKVEQNTDKKLAEVKKIEESKITTSKEPKYQKTEIKPTNNVGLYREIPNDKSITDRIYFDGEKYTVQASSWKSTSIAEKEVNKLIKRGFDAFIVKVFIKSKGSTWNRVRIGYFNSQKEAEEFLKKNKF